MDKATEMYKEIIDELANMSKDCADARGVKKGKLPGTDAEQMGMNDILKKLKLFFVRLRKSNRQLISSNMLSMYMNSIHVSSDFPYWIISFDQLSSGSRNLRLCGG